jgi:hypothetical protein
MHALPRLVWRWLHQVWVDDDDNLTFLYSFVDSNQVTCPCYTHHHCCPADGRNGIPAIPADVHAQCGCLFARANEVHESFRCSFLLASSCVSAATAGARVAVRAHASASLRFVLQRGTQPGGRQWCLFRVWQACAHRDAPPWTCDISPKGRKNKMVNNCKHRNQNDASNGRMAQSLTNYLFDSCYGQFHLVWREIAGARKLPILGPDIFAFLSSRAKGGERCIFIQRLVRAMDSTLIVHP